MKRSWREGEGIDGQKPVDLGELSMGREFAGKLHKNCIIPGFRLHAPGNRARATQRGGAGWMFRHVDSGQMAWVREIDIVPLTGVPTSRRMRR
ncbi:hypothetical protein [Paraburkholderia sp. J69-1]|uniref:hypothetical protein n=1 Tax=Paraburkholderia sp. J69-1 TaxID=2805436 RepID=UPI002AB74C48|nr:hypothetical protein [Paraburkholderia sp. J69-1]